MNRNQIGKRLSIIRDELARPGEDAWTQGRVAAETGLTLNQVARLEQSAAGSIEGLVTLLLFYHGKGYNISWVLLPDNSGTSKLALSENTKTVSSREVINKLNKLKGDLSKDVDALIDELAE
ncbi:hypothetical protein [Hymenobacter sp. YC55]|uniref:hypothetical protein n=1 Tax=Hymenobacter sp. YC55 TaxID=3034019 RepID=UPI0023F88607|nr:hypothetical protein [Hymenobacter sp. YC55]MDF7815115.1 hypothetical protein [Hymenobacter sp. YC55]